MDILRDLGMRTIYISAYNAKANRLIKSGYSNIISYIKKTDALRTGN
jgi:hypothetical protein